METVDRKDKLIELLNMNFVDIVIQYNISNNCYITIIHGGTVRELLCYMYLKKISILNIENVLDKDDDNITRNITKILNNIIEIMHEKNISFYYYDKKIKLRDELYEIIDESLIGISNVLSYKNIDDIFSDEILTPDEIRIKRINRNIKNFIENASSLSEKI